MVLCFGTMLPISTEIPSLFAPATLLRARSQVQNIGEIGISAALREGRRGSSVALGGGAVAYERGTPVSCLSKGLHILRGGASDSEVGELSSYGDMKDVEEGDEAVAFKDPAVQVISLLGFGARCAVDSLGDHRRSAPPPRGRRVDSLLAVGRSAHTHVLPAASLRPRIPCSEARRPHTLRTRSVREKPRS